MVTVLTGFGVVQLRLFDQRRLPTTMLKLHLFGLLYDKISLNVLLSLLINPQQVEQVEFGLFTG